MVTSIHTVMIAVLLTLNRNLSTVSFRDNSSKHFTWLTKCLWNFLLLTKEYLAKNMSSSIVIYNGLKILCPVAGCYLCLSKFMLPYFAASNCMFKVSNRKTRARCGIYSKLTIKTLERHQWRRSDVFIVNLEQISHLVLVFLLSTLSR